MTTMHEQHPRRTGFLRPRWIVASVVLIAIVVAIVLILTYTGGGGGSGGGPGYLNHPLGRAGSIPARPSLAS